MEKQEDFSRRQEVRFSALAAKASKIRGLYATAGIKIHPKSGMGYLLSSAELAISTNSKDLTNLQYWDVLNLERVSKALLPIADHEKVEHYLKKLKQDDLNFFLRNRSIAKDSLFELEVYRSLLALGAEVELDEPDVVLSTEAGEIGFACKKTYSVGGVESVLSKAVHQIETSSSKFGVVAFNIDHLIPEETFVRAKSYDSAANLITGFCREFLAKRSNIFQRYFNGSRIVGVVAVCSVIVETIEIDKSTSNFQQWWFWTSPNIGSESSSAARLIRDTLGNA